MTSENVRLQVAREPKIPKRKWGPCLSGAVREDYSEGGNAWDYFTHDQARSRAYRWGEDELAGILDDHQRLCFSMALCKGMDPILKERLFDRADLDAGQWPDSPGAHRPDHANVCK